MIPCDWPGCAGTVEETGFCDTCFRQPRRPGGSATPTSRTGGATDPLSLPDFSFPDPSSRIQRDPMVPERSRRCGNCGSAVGRSHHPAQPAISQGYCDECGRPFSFRPSLHDGDLAGDQYRVLGCFARGGLGWIYLAVDTHLDDQLVVLKGLIDAGEDATAERRALTMMDHPNIVRIFNFVTHPDPHTGKPRDYIVMEYVDGLVLSDVRYQALQGEAPLGEPLLAEHVIACVLQILAAFDYLHGREWLYCDMKPENVIVRSGRHGERANRIKLIDLGAMRRFGDRTSRIIQTTVYAVGHREIEERGLTVRSDLYTVGKTLDSLYKATTDWADRRRGSAVEQGLESLRRLVNRAAHADFDRRFPGAAQMADQLAGVQREIAALRHGIDRPAPSTMFTPSATLLDAGLGAVPPLDRWMAADVTDGELAGGRPSAVAVALGLPVPRVDPADPAADFLAAAGAPDPARLLDKLAAARLESVELWLARCRAHLALGEPAEAQENLRRARGRVGDDWRVRWHQALLALIRGEIPGAESEFDAVYDALPGELAPKLALAWCAEQRGDPDPAQRLYTAIWSRDRMQASAAFGLARIRLSRGDRAGAVSVLDKVPALSPHYEAATVAAVVVLSGQLVTGGPTADDLREATARLPGLYLDGGQASGAARDRLTALVREAALRWVHTNGGPLPVDGGPVLDTEPTETRLRELLEKSYRALAGQARDAGTHGVLVDLANVIRPLTLR